MLKILRRIIQEINNAQDFKEALTIMVKRIGEALDTEASSIFLLDRRHGEYVLMATQGLNPKAVGKVRVNMAQGLIGLVGEKEEPINLDDASKHPRFLHVSDLGEDPYKAFLGVPIIYHRRVLGVLMVQQREQRRYDEDEEAFLVTMATQLAGIIAQAESAGELTHLLSTNHEEPCGEATYGGIPSAPGIGIGVGVVVYPLADLSAVPDREAEDIILEIATLERALNAAREDIRVLGERMSTTLPPEEHLLFEAYQRMLDSSSLGAELIAAIHAGNWAQGALRQVIENHIWHFENLESEYLRERAADIRDLGHRVLFYLQKNDRTLPEYPEKTILIGEEISAADLAEVPEGRLAGVICTKGSGASHVAILARAMGVPTVMGVTDIDVSDLQDEVIIVDGYYGQIYVSPTQALQQEFQRLVDAEKVLVAQLEELKDLPAETRDGHRIGMLVNTGLGSDVSLSLSAGAEGVGLYRTEIPFLMRDRFPSGEEQRVIYRQLLGTFAPRFVTMRTLDVGGDKPLPYFPITEDNPFLGWRGMRMMLDQPEIFLVQVRAMLRASHDHNNLRIMLPMISDVGEVDEAMRLIKKAYADVIEEGLVIEMPPVGVMIEVPSAVYQARALAKRVDFLSVGSNDLTQYILAVDRNNARVANLFDSLHPAVLRALIQVVDSGHQEGKHVSICGEMAGDPASVIVLVAMGFDSLSMSAASLPRVKWVVRQFTKKRANEILQEVLSMESAVLIRCHLELALEQAGLSGLLRAGR